MMDYDKRLEEQIKKYEEQIRKHKEDRIMKIGAVFLGIFLIISTLWAWPTYNVWQKEMKGKSQLKQAEWNRQILILEAEATLKAEELNALAEVERAKGMAAAMEIENGTLTETYIKYLWVRGMVGNNNVIYIPTEATIQILEIKK